MSYTDLRDFTEEYSQDFPEIGVRVQIEKLGGGTVGKSYVGTWRYIVTSLNSGSELERGQDLESHIPTTHEEAAESVAEYFEDED